MNDVGNTATSAGFRRLRVSARRQESDSIVSFDLVPADGVALPPFLAGQFVSLRLTLPTAEVVTRTYSLSGDPADTTRWRISVKREAAPPGRDDVPAGRGSSYLHDSVQVGDELDLAGPSGAFVCGDDTTRPVVLLSGGVGQTPLVSMLHRLRAMAGAQSRPVFFIHACESGAAHAFRREVAAIAAAHTNVHVHYCYRQPSPQDRMACRFDSEGLISRETLQCLLPLDDYEVYLCGPPGFMQANWRLLRSLGVARERLHYEFFGPATVLEGAANEEPVCVPAAQPHGHGEQRPQFDVDATTVRFGPQARPLAWDAGCESLLDFAEKQGVAVPFSCRVGICNTCLTPLTEGEVEYTVAPLDPPPQGTVLLCCAKPLGNVTLTLPAVPERQDYANTFDESRIS